jgi:Putative outer membrane beta-barrel porin, MtrB/PioB
LMYYASNFDNKVKGLTWTNWAAPASTMTMSSTPSNQMHQLSLVAGHDLSSSTRLVANASYTRNTQNDAFLTDSSTALVPVSSLDGRVISKFYTVKLSSRPSNGVNLALQYKYDQRKNETAVHTFGFYDANEAAGAANINAAFSTALGVPAALLRSNANINASRPYSRRLSELTGTADLRLTPTQAIRMSYELQNLHRWCQNTWISCIDAAETKENTLRAEWRGDLLSNLNAHLGYSLSKRKVDFYDENAFLALVPMANVSPSTATGGASAYSFMIANGWTGYGPIAGFAATAGNLNLFFPLNNALANATYANQNRISELFGMRRFNMANRQREKLRAAVDWQPAEKFSLQANVDLNRDDYDASRYGLVDSRDWTANLEGSYNANENLAFSLFYTHEDQRARSAGNTYTANSAAANVNGFTAISGGCFATIALRNASNKIDPCLDWATDMRDKTDVYGMSVNRKALFTSKLDVGIDFTITRARSTNNISGGNYANNPLAVAGAAAGTTAAFYIPAAALPTVTADTTEIRVKADYALSAASTLRFAYLYADLSASDYAYEGMQFGGLAGVLPSLETAPNYTIHVVALSYAHRF